MTTLELQPAAAAGKDTFLYSATNNNYGARTNFWTGTAFKTLIFFDLSEIPAGATCVSATLYLWLYSANGGTGTVTVYSVASGNGDWVEGTKNGTTEAGSPCWNQKGYTTANWAGSAGMATSGTDYEASALGSFTHTNGDGAGTQYSTTLTAARIKQWFGGNTQNYGLLLVADVNQFYFCSSDHGTAGYLPKLVVEYLAPLTVSKSEAITVGESPAATVVSGGALTVSKSEAVTVGESPTATVTALPGALSVSKSEAATVADSPTASVGALPSTLSVSASESVTVGESVDADTFAGYFTDFEGVTKTDAHHLSISDDLTHWFEFEDDDDGGADFAIVDNITAHSGDECLYMELTDTTARRCEFDVYQQSVCGTGDYTFSTWLRLPADYNLHVDIDWGWHEFCVLHQEGDGEVGLFYFALMLQQPDIEVESWNLYLEGRYPLEGGMGDQFTWATIEDFPLVRGDWFSVRAAIKLDESAGTIQVWVDDELIIDLSSKQTTYGLSPQMITPAKLYFEIDETTLAEHYIWCDDLQLWPGLVPPGEILEATASDSVTVGESAAAAVAALPGALTPSVSDTATVGESAAASVTAIATLEATASDSVSIGEDSAATIGALATLTASADDTVTVGDTPAASVVALPGALTPSVSDTVTVGEDVAATVGGLSVLAADVSDSVTVGESVNATITALPAALAPSVSDTVTVGENATANVVAFGVLALAVADSATVTDAPTASITALPSALTVDVADSATTAEDSAASVTALSTLTLSVSDSVVASDAQSLFIVTIPLLTITVADAIMANETVNAQVTALSTLAVSVDDAVSVADAPTVDVIPADLALAVQDSVSASEAVTVSSSALAVLTVDVSDSIGVSEVSLLEIIITMSALHLWPRTLTCTLRPRTLACALPARTLTNTLEPRTLTNTLEPRTLTCTLHDIED